jgi:hypothetical protein
VLTVAWAELKELMRVRDPEYLSTVRGVSREEISLCEKGCGIVLPSLYVEFLMTMGAGHGRFFPFGATQVCNFYALIEQLPAEDYPGQKYFKIAFENDPGEITPYDFFLDLGGSDGHDAPLVWIESGIEFEAGDEKKVGFTLQEWFDGRVFHYFEKSLRPHLRTVYLSPPSDSGIRQCMQQAIGLLSRMGLEPALPLMPRVACFRGESLSAKVEHRDTTRGVRVGFGADDPTKLRLAIEQLVDGLPGVSTVESEAPRSRPPGD